MTKWDEYDDLLLSISNSYQKEQRKIILVTAMAMITMVCCGLYIISQL